MANPTEPTITKISVASQVMRAVAASTTSAGGGSIVHSSIKNTSALSENLKNDNTLVTSAAKMRADIAARAALTPEVSSTLSNKHRSKVEAQFAAENTRFAGNEERIVESMTTETNTVGKLDIVAHNLGTVNLPERRNPVPDNNAKPIFETPVSTSGKDNTDPAVTSVKPALPPSGTMTVEEFIEKPKGMSARTGSKVSQSPAGELAAVRNANQSAIPSAAPVSDASFVEAGEKAKTWSKLAAKTEAVRFEAAAQPVMAALPTPTADSRPSPIAAFAGSILARSKRSEIFFAPGEIDKARVSQVETAKPRVQTVATMAVPKFAEIASVPAPATVMTPKPNMARIGYDPGIAIDALNLGKTHCETVAANASSAKGPAPEERMMPMGSVSTMSAKAAFAGRSSAPSGPSGGMK